MFMESPKIINMGVVRGYCPGKCIHCPIGKTPVTEREKFGYGFMEIENFKAICYQIREFGNKDLPCLRIHGVGEPTMMPSLGEALTIAKENNIQTWVFTMGLGCERNIFLESIINADIVEFSVNSATAEDYKNTKGLDHDAFEEVLARIEILTKLKKHPKILISRVQTKNKKTDEDFLNFWKLRNADDVFIRSFHDYGERIEDKDLLIQRKNVNISKRSCLVPVARMNIDGVLRIVVRCFNELFDDTETVVSKSIGNILQDVSLKNIWFGETMNQWRENTFDYLQCRNCRSCQPVNPNTSEKQLEKKS